MLPQCRFHLDGKYSSDRMLAGITRVEFEKFDFSRVWLTEKEMPDLDEVWVMDPRPDIK